MGTDIANASMYDGSTAMAEAATMACRMTRRDRVVVARSVHPHYREVLRDLRREPGADDRRGGLPRGRHARRRRGRGAPSQGAAAVVFQYPNFFGVVEDPRPIVETRQGGRRHDGRGRDRAGGDGAPRAARARWAWTSWRPSCRPSACRSATAVRTSACWRPPRSACGRCPGASSGWPRTPRGAPATC